MTSFESITNWQGVLVKVGLAQPASRAFVASVTVAGVAYLAGLPKASFRADGSMKPLAFLSPDPEATTTHFLLVPVVAAGVVYLFT